MALRVCVFGSSKDGHRPKYLEHARELGLLLGKEGHICVNGAGKTGCMGALNSACIESGGHVEGVIHRMWVVDTDELHKGLDNVIVTDGPCLGERKSKLMENCDCIISLPGGVGTFDELYQAIAERQLGLSTWPIALVNTDGYYDGVWKNLENMTETGLLYKAPSELVYMAKTPADALEYCKNNLGPKQDPNPVAKPRDVPLEGNYTSGIFHGVLIGCVVTTCALSLYHRH